MYLTLVNKIEKMWLAPDVLGLGRSPSTALEDLEKSDTFCMMKQKATETLGGGRQCVDRCV